jgi:hypothetical protein
LPAFSALLMLLSASFRTEVRVILSARDSQWPAIRAKEVSAIFGIILASQRKSHEDEECLGLVELGRFLHLR